MESYFAHRQVAPTASSSDHTGAFQPFFSVLGAPSAGPEPVAPNRSLAVDSTAPQIELIQAEGRVTKIVVTCRCCERIELDCEY